MILRQGCKDAIDTRWVPAVNSELPSILRAKRLCSCATSKEAQ
jgi:hypothetical protein